MYKIFSAFTPFTVVYFVLLVFIGAFFLLNLTLAVIKVKFTDAEVFSDSEIAKRSQTKPRRGPRV
jgi:hypothetical protein